MSRLASFVVLIAVILVVAFLFFRVILEFVVPMFLAAVLVVVFRPLHKWFEYKLAGHPRWAAAATTVCIILIVLVPVVAIGWNAYREVAALAREALDEGASGAMPHVGQAPEDEASETQTSEEGSSHEKAAERQAADEPTSIANASDNDVTEADKQADDRSELDIRIERAIGTVCASLEKHTGVHIPWQPSEIRVELIRKAGAWMEQRGGAAALGGAQWILSVSLRLIVGLAIMIISVYFFLADGPGMIVTIMHLSPLDDRYELELLNKFSNVSRSVVVATLLSAFAQGVLAGIGYYLAGIQIVFALTGLTMLLAVVPFLGAASVWLPTAAWLLLGEERPVAAAVLALYGLAVVSTIDNFIKPFILHGQSNLHPLLALLSVLGGVAAMGPIGILVGPMAVAFLQALLGMLRREIDELGEAGPALPTPPASGDTRVETQKAVVGTSETEPSNHANRAPLEDAQPTGQESARKESSAERQRPKRRSRRRKRT